MKPEAMKPADLPILMSREPGAQPEPAAVIFADFDHAGLPVYAAVQFADGHRQCYAISGDTYTCINSGSFLDVFVLHDQYPQDEAHQVFSTHTIVSEQGTPLNTNERLNAIGYRFLDDLTASPFESRIETVRAKHVGGDAPVMIFQNGSRITFRPSQEPAAFTAGATVIYNSMEKEQALVDQANAAIEHLGVHPFESPMQLSIEWLSNEEPPAPPQPPEPCQSRNVYWRDIKTGDKVILRTVPDNLSTTGRLGSWWTDAGGAVRGDCDGGVYWMGQESHDAQSFLTNRTSEEIDVPAPAVPSTGSVRGATIKERYILSEAVLTVLSTMTFKGNIGYLDETKGRLDKKLYAAVRDALVALGGPWKKKPQAHVFQEGIDAKALIDAAIVAGEVVHQGKLLQQFFTQPTIADLVIERADIRPGDLTLEPSAGDGALALRARRAGAVITCVEMDEKLRQVLIDAGLDVSPVRNFLDFAVSARAFDRVVMNPPFTGGQDVAHITAAFGLLKPGGRLVAIASAAVKYRKEEAFERFRALVSSQHGTVEDLPAGAFVESGTNAKTVLIVLERRI